VNRSSLPRLWEQDLLREGEYYCLVEDAMLLRITTHQYNLNFLNRFWKDPQIIITKIRAVGHELLNVDGRTGITNLMIAFRDLPSRQKSVS